MSDQLLTDEQAQYGEEYMYMQLYYIYLTTLHFSFLPHKYGMFCPMKIFTAKDNLCAAIFTWNYVTHFELLNRKFF